MFLCFSISSHLILSITVFNCVKLPISKNQVYVLTGHNIALLLFIFSLNSIVSGACPLAEIEAIDSEQELFRMM